MPEGTQSESYFAALVGFALLGVVGSSTLTLTAILFVRKSGQVADPDRFTQWGQFLFRPEHDTTFYFAGILVALAVVVTLAAAGNWRMTKTPAAAPFPHPLALRAAIMCFAVAAVAGCLWAFIGGRAYLFRGTRVPAGYLAVMLGIGVAAVSVAGLGVARLGPALARVPTPPLGEDTSRHTRLGVGDLLVPIFVASIVYIPGWTALAGHIYEAEEFFSWDFFAMGPAVAFRHGAALGSEMYAPYGVGWPALFGLLSPVLALSYGRMLQVSVVYGCLYFAGVYLFLRILSLARPWAAAGTFLALHVQLFSGLGRLLPLWRLPSLTVIRRPFDVWVMIALALHLRSRSPVWPVVAGALSGLALVFVTDSGAYLTATVGCYWLFTAGLDRNRMHLRRDLLTCACAAGLVFVVGLGIASRGTLWQPRFWSRWLEPIADGAQGFTALPLAGRSELYASGDLAGAGTMVLFVAVVVFYLGIVGYTAVKSLHRRATPLDVIAGCLACYGLLSLIHFVGRSDAANVHPVLVPFAVLSAVIVARLHRALRSAATSRRPAGDPSRRLVWSLVPWSAAGLALVVLISSPGFRDYPGALQGIGEKGSGDGLCLIEDPVDACGLSPAARDGVEEFRSIAAEIRRLASSGEKVALLDDRDPVYYLAAGVRPWGTYSPLLTNLFRNSQVAAVEDQLRRQRPVHVLIRTRQQTPPHLVDPWLRFRGFLERQYTLTRQVGRFEIWSAPQSRGA
ncbi:MAG TPA: hypothetical protein VHG90_04470 [Acidimicrobiales bacterium]|nr:hypothetical protein [Acidimicrobiales bacterium]